MYEDAITGRRDGQVGTLRQTQKWLLSGAIILALLSGCAKHAATPKERDLYRVKSESGPKAKKVILICVDSLMSKAIDEGIKQNKLPAFRFLMEHGQYYRNVVTSFPTMSVSIDSTLLTGTHPDEHHVPALVWYSTEEKKVHNYGTGLLEISRHGVDRMLADALVHLNGSHLNPRVPTLFEELARKGLKSGSVNGLIYRGKSGHLLSIPAWVRGPANLPKQLKVKGPDFLAFGALSNPLAGVKKLPDNVNDRFGMTNEYAVEATKYLIWNDRLPDFLYVYFPDLDMRVHRKGPADLEGVIRTDRQLQALLQAFGSREEALKKAVIIVSGDNGMAPVLPARQGAVIDLERSLKGYDILKPGTAVTDRTELVVAVNDRMAYVYKLKPRASIGQIAQRLKADPRIDILAWQDKGWIRVVRGGTPGEFAFRPKGRMTDRYRQAWTLDKEPAVLDIKTDNRKHTLEYGQYPDALRRLSAALHSHPGEFLVVTAKPGYELAFGGSPTHEGGAGHGALGQEESLVPLLIGGTDRKPESLRIVDLKRYLLQLLSQR